jgi:alpha-galactosidase
MQSLAGRTVESTEDVTIGYVGGGSRNWARTLMRELAGCTDLSGTVRLYDIDQESAEKNAELGNWVQTHDEAVGDWSYEAVGTLSGALEDADFVICSTQDAPSETMKHDLEIPAEYGIYQTVGDTVGPGGTVRAMRAIPQYADIAAGIREHCPDAWVINYTNPMTVCTRTLFAEYPDINAVGICHEVRHVKHVISGWAEEHLGLSVDPDEMDVNVLGINHFTFVDDARWRSEDVFPAIDAELESRKPLPNFESGEFGPVEKPGDYFHNEGEVKLDLYDRFGLLGAAGDRHLVEFVPWYLDVDEKEEIHRWGTRVTESEHRTSHWPRHAERREEYLTGEREFSFGDTGEETVAIMRALAGIEPLKTNVNVPNRGQVDDLPRGAVVETNALMTGGAITPLNAGSLPRQVHSMVLPHVNNHETLIEAGPVGGDEVGDLDHGFQAFLNDALVTIDREAARECYARLIEKQRPYFEDWNVEGADVMR